MKFAHTRQHQRKSPRFTLRKDGSKMIVMEQDTPRSDRISVYEAKREARRLNREEKA